MGITVKGAVGPDVLQDGVESPLRMGKAAELIVQELHGRYYEQTYRGYIYSACNQTAQVLTTGTLGTYTGLCLYNPIGSKVNLIPLKAKFAISSATGGTGAFIGLTGGFSGAGGISAQTVALVPTSNVLGSPKGTGIALSSCQFLPGPTATWVAALTDGYTAITLAPPTPPFDFEGVFCLQPGSFVAFSSTFAVTGFGFMSWEEVPL